MKRVFIGLIMGLMLTGCASSPVDESINPTVITTIEPTHVAIETLKPTSTPILELENAEDVTTSSNSSVNTSANESSSVDDNSSYTQTQASSTAPVKSQEQINCESNWGTWKDDSWCDWGTDSESTQTTPSKSQEQIDCENSWGTWKDGSWCDWGSNTESTQSTPSKSQEQIDCENSWGTWKDGSWCDWGTTTTDQTSQMVWKSATGSKYHSYNSCGNMNPAKATQLTLSEALALGLGSCSKCW